MIALCERGARDCVWRAVSVLKDCYICGHRVGLSLASVRSCGAWRQHSSSVPLAVPGKARLPLLGQNSGHMSRLRHCHNCCQPFPAVVCSPSSAPVCLAAMTEAGWFCRARACLFILSLPFPWAGAALQLWLCFLCSGRLRLVPVTAVHRSQRDWSVFFCLLSETGHVYSKHYWETKAVCRKDHLFVPLCLVPSLTGCGPKSVINDMYPSSFCF